MLFLKHKIFSSKLSLNSFWGLIGNLSKSLLQALFYVIIARAFNKEILGKYFIALAIYNLLTAYSALGLGQWFAREYLTVKDKTKFTNIYFKILFISGLFFFCINSITTLFYADPYVKILIFLSGINIFFDNLVYGINNLNIVEYEQNRSVKVLFLDSFLRCLIALLCLIAHLSLVWLSLLLIFARSVTLQLMLHIGSSNIKLHYWTIVRTPISRSDFNKVVLQNWAFIVINGLSIANWKICSLVISKMLPVSSLSDFELSFRLYSMLQILPLVLVSTAYPRIAELLLSKSSSKLLHQYDRILNLINFYDIAAIVLYCAFAPYVVPLFFGKEYLNIVDRSIYMMLSIIPQSIILLQSRLLIAGNHEKIDMYMNLLALAVNVVLLFIFLSSSLVRGLEAVNLSIFIALFIVVLVQDQLLVFYRYFSLTYMGISYLTSFAPVVVFFVMSRMHINKLVIVISVLFFYGLSYIFKQICLKGNSFLSKNKL